MSQADDTNHRDAMEWQVELAIDARFKGFGSLQASGITELWFGHDWIARLWKATYGEEATRKRHSEILARNAREHHRLHPGFNGSFGNRRLIGCGPDNPFFGKKHTAEARAKMSAKQRGKTISDEQIRKFRETHQRNFPTSEAFGAAVRERYERHPETKEKLRAARLKQRFLKSWTRPERILADLLSQTVKNFDDHVPVGGLGVVDFMVGKTICEVFGDFWHANPLRYGEGLQPLHPRQIRQREKDAARMATYRRLGYRVEVFWEDDLLRNQEACKARLVEIARLENAQLP